MEPTVTAHGLTFRPLINKADIQRRVEEIGEAIKAKYEGRRPLFLGVLNGAFVFAADLIRACDIDCEISFIKLSSYRGVRSSGEVKTLIGLEVEIRDRHVIIVEDIIDSGKTLNDLLPDLEKLEPASIEVAALLVKPDAMEYSVRIHYTGFKISPNFVIGYGLDYNGLGRNLEGVYQLVN